MTRIISKRRAASTFAWGMLCLIGAVCKVYAAEFEITADSFTVDKQVNLSSAAYFQGQASAPGSPASATQLTSPGGLYFDGTYYNVWNSQTGAWVQVATGTVETGRVAKAGDTMTGQLTLAGSTLTVTGSEFSVGGSTLDVTGGDIGIGTTGPQRLLQLKGGSAGALTYLSSLQGVSGNLGTAVGIAFNPTDPMLTKGALVYEANGSGFERGDFQFLQQSNGDLNSAALANSVMTIANSGNVGVGTPSPTAPLHVRRQSSGAIVQLLKLSNEASAVQNGGASIGIYNGDPAGSGSYEQARIDGFQSTPGATGGGLRLYTGNASVGTVVEAIRIDANQNVGIGTASPGYKLDVAGQINTNTGVSMNGALYTNPDYVFEPGYKLMPLERLRAFVAARKHLPHIPSTKEVRKTGVEIFEQNRVQLENLEEAYLYLFQMKDRLGDTQARLDEALNRLEILQARVDRLQARVDKLEKR